MSIRAVIFDFDLTIASIRPWDAFFHPHTLLLSQKMKQICDRYRGIRSFDLLQHIQNDFSQHFSFVQYQKAFDRIYHPKSILSESQELINLCDKLDIPRGIISDHNSLEKLTSIGLSTGWSSVINSQEYGALKPLPDTIFSIASQLDIPTNSLLVVGDRWETDGLLASTVGAMFLHVQDIKHNLQHICFGQ